MSKYAELDTAVFSVFATKAWIKTGIKTYPSNFVWDRADSEFLRVTVLPTGRGLNLASLSGLLIIDIFTSAGSGPKGASLIADTLDSHLVGKSLSAGKGQTLQFYASTLEKLGNDRSNPTLVCSKFSIPFNFFGV